MGGIHLKHPIHGEKIAHSDVEAKYDQENGWVLADLAAPEPVFTTDSKGTVEVEALIAERDEAVAEAEKAKEALKEAKADIKELKAELKALKADKPAPAAPVVPDFLKPQG